MCIKMRELSQIEISNHDQRWTCSLTKDERVIIAAVMTSGEDYHIMETSNSKIDKLNKNEISYDLLLYITSSKTKHALPYDTREKKNWILGAKNIPKIEEHVKAILRGEY